jgi:hypothetical protein
MEAKRLEKTARIDLDPTFRQTPPGHRLKHLSIYNTVVVGENTNIVSGHTEQCPIAAADDKGDGRPAWR